MWSGRKKKLTIGSSFLFGFFSCGQWLLLIVATMHKGRVRARSAKRKHNSEAECDRLTQQMMDAMAWRQQMSSWAQTAKASSTHTCTLQAHMDAVERARTIERHKRARTSELSRYLHNVPPDQQPRRVAYSLPNIPLSRPYTLLPHQRRTLEFCERCMGHDQHMRGGLLNLEMGLGKSLLALCLVVHSKEVLCTPSPSLIVCPLSVMPQMRDEADKFFGSTRLRVLVLHTDYLDAHTVKSAWNGDDMNTYYDLVITTYHTVRVLGHLYDETKSACLTVPTDPTGPTSASAIFSFDAAAGSSGTPPDHTQESLLDLIGSFKSKHRPKRLFDTDATEADAVREWLMQSMNLELDSTPSAHAHPAEGEARVDQQPMSVDTPPTPTGSEPKEVRSGRPTSTQGKRKSRSVHSSWSVPVARWLFETPWHHVVVDESQTMANPKAQVTTYLHRLSRAYGWCMSGTPAPNGPKDLKSQFMFMGWRPLVGTNASGASLVNQAQYTRHIHSVSLADSGVRLPNLSVYDVHVPLGVEQTQLYERGLRLCSLLHQLWSRSTGQSTYKHSVGSLTDGYWTMRQLKSSILAVITWMRLLCQAPHLLVTKQLSAVRKNPLPNGTHTNRSSPSEGRSSSGSSRMFKPARVHNAELLQRVVSESKARMQTPATETPAEYGPDAWSSALSQLDEIDDAECAAALVDLLSPCLEDSARSETSGAERPALSAAGSGDVSDGSSPSQADEADPETLETDELWQEVKQHMLDEASFQIFVRRPEEIRWLMQRESSAGYLSVRVQFVHRYLTRIDPSDKVIVFSEFRHMTALMSDALNHSRLFEQHHWLAVCIDGSVGVKERHRRIRAFSSEPFQRVLCGTNAIACGLNLTAANHLIILGPGWNASSEDQPLARVYRLGQTKPVVCIRLIALDTVESHMRQVRDDKDRKLAQASHIQLHGHTSEASLLSALSQSRESTGDKRPQPVSADDTVAAAVWAGVLKSSKSNVSAQPSTDQLSEDALRILSRLHRTEGQGLATEAAKDVPLMSSTSVREVKVLSTTLPHQAVSASLPDQQTDHLSPTELTYENLSMLDEAMRNMRL